MVNERGALYTVRITALRDSESQERVALYLSGWMQNKSVEEIRGYLNHLPVVITRRAPQRLAERLQRELADLGAQVELTPIEPETVSPFPGTPPELQSGGRLFPAVSPPGPGLPWDKRRETGFFRAWWDTVFFALRWPQEFCSRISPAGSYFEPLLYAGLTALIGTLGTIIWQIPFQVLPLALIPGLTGKLGAGFGMLVILLCFLVFLIIFPLLFVVVEFIWAAIAHGFVYLVGGRSGFAATFRVNCFANSAQLLQLIPVIGGLAAMIYGLVFIYFGYRFAHGLQPKAAIAAIVLPVAFMLALVVAVVIVFLVALFGSLGSFDLEKLIPE